MYDDFSIIAENINTFAKKRDIHKSSLQKRQIYPYRMLVK